MRTHSIVFASIGALSVAALVGACDNPGSRLPPRPSTPFVQGLDISGPDSVAPGQTAQFTATVRLSDGTRKTATAASGLLWTSTNPLVLRVNTSGVATAQERLSEATLTARMPNPGGGRGSFIQSFREVVVVPSGTFRVVGAVGDEVPAVPLAGARVEVTSQSLVAMTDFAGRYRLYGVPPDAELRVTRDGYESVGQKLQLAAHATQNFTLQLSQPRLVLTGPYKLEIDGGGCAGLPADLRNRQYDAVLTQNGSSVEVALSGRTFRLNGSGRGNRFSGRADPAGATFKLEPYETYYYYYYYGYGSYPSVAEHLLDGTYLVIQGTFIGTGSATRLSGTLTGGGLFHWSSRFPGFGVLMQSCTTPPATFTLTPR